MEWLMSKISLSLQHLFPVVKAEELQDPQVILREKCQNSECQKLYNILDTCNTRVTSKKQTTESCHEEMIDFVTCLDHCVAKTLFTKLK